MSMLWTERYSDIIAKGRVNSPCCAPDGSRSSRIIAPDALVCHTPVTNCLIASDSQIHTECIYFVWKHAIVVVYSSENHIFSEVYINLHTQEHLR